MPRPRKNRSVRVTGVKAASQGRGSVLARSSEALPESAEACARELELLEEQQRAIMNRMKQVTAQLQQILQKQATLSEAFPEADAQKTSNLEVVGRAGAISYISGSEDEAVRVLQVSNSPGVENHPTSVPSADDDMIAHQSSPLISALKKLQQSRDQKRGIKMWSQNLANLFFVIDVDGSRRIDSYEYNQMLEQLDLSEMLKSSLRDKFKRIDKDASNDINLEEFLMFFLKYPMFKQELFANASNNAPYIYENTLSRTQYWRQWLYCIVECPEYNFVSKVIFCTDIILTLIPIVILCIEGVRPSVNVKWFQHPFMWIVSIFFALEYMCGLMTCKYKKKFIFDVVHTFELVSFLFWLIYKTFGVAGSQDPMGFVMFRVIRYVNLHKVFRLDALQEDIDIYAHTLKLA